LAIKNLQDNLRKENLPIVWTEIEKVHLTLNFLGKMPHHDINEIIKNIREACEGLPAFTLKFPFLETLYKKHDDSLVYLSVVGELDSLCQILSQTVSEVAVQPKRYWPHVTIGRIKKLDSETTKQTLNTISNLDLSLNIPEMRVDKFSLYESILHGDKATYQKIRDFGLS
jgi:2'-5' RNA ligase